MKGKGVRGQETEDGERRTEDGGGISDMGYRIIGEAGEEGEGGRRRTEDGRRKGKV